MNVFDYTYPTNYLSLKQNNPYELPSLLFFVSPLFDAFLFGHSQVHEDCEKVKLALEEVLSNPPSEKVVINNELAGIINRHAEEPTGVPTNSPTVAPTNSPTVVPQ